jgi:hypothetical protein
MSDPFFGNLLRTRIEDVVSGLHPVDIARLFRPSIVGIEVTQSIQYYNAAAHLTDPADRGPDNSVQLIANKAAWVRVYVRSGLYGSPTTVGGELTVNRRRLGFLWTPVGTYNAQGTVVAQQSPGYATERATTAMTLNFVIPSGDFAGTMHLTVRLTDTAGDTLDTDSVTVGANLRQTLRVRAILVSYNGPSTANPGPAPPPNLTLAAPTLADLANTAALALRMMPVGAAGLFAGAGSLAWNLPLDDARTSAGGCSNNWNSLLTSLTNLRTNDGNRGDVVYYGLLPTGIPLGVPGCGVGGLGSAAVGAQATFVHEIGHGYGFQHTPSGAVGTPDPNYPVYQPYPSASIGEYGLDISNGAVLAPQSTFDYMSYGPTTWMSLYQHRRLIDHARLDPRWFSDLPWDEIYKYKVPEIWEWPLPDPPPDLWKWINMSQEPVISITGIVHPGRRIEVTTVARVAANPMPPGTATTMTADLLGEDGEILAQAVLHRLVTHGGCGCPEEGEAASYPFQALIPNVAPGAALRIGEEGEELWSRRAPQRAPRVGGIEARVREHGELDLRWKAEAATDDTEAWLQWSGDRGESWHGLATGLSGGAATLGLAGVADGVVELRLLVSDGFHTTVSESVRIEVPSRPPEAAILHPHHRQVLLAGGTLQLYGSAADSAGRPLPEETVRWYLDGEHVGDGMEVWTVAPEPGEHMVTLMAAGDGGDTEVAVEFVTIGADTD